MLRPSPDVRPQKRRRSNRIPDEDADDEVILSPVAAARQEEVTSVYTAQLVVYDQHLHRLLTDGDYEVVLQEVSDQVTSCGRSRASWETISGHCVSTLVRNRHIVQFFFSSSKRFFSSGNFVNYYITWKSRNGHKFIHVHWWSSEHLRFLYFVLSWKIS